MRRRKTTFEIKMIPSLGFDKTELSIPSEEAAVNLTFGEYFFRCNVHPNQMTGTFTVEVKGRR